MESILGIACKDHVIVAASAQAAYSILQLKDTEDKLHLVDHNKILATSGPPGDRVQFVEYITRNLKLNSIRQGQTCTGESAAHFIRNQLATSIRSQNPFLVNCLFAAFDAPLPELQKLNLQKGQHLPDGSGAKLWFVDYLGNLQDIPYGAQGYGGSFAIAVLDRYYNYEQTEAQTIALLRQCIQEVQARIIINNSKYIVKIINKEGIKVVEL